MTRIVAVSETGSTNADLIALARTGAGEGLWLRADRQTDGRGRHGRAWDSPIGNFAGSTLVHLRAGDPPAASLALVAAVALDETVSVLLPASARARLTIKWPNDLLLGGAKLSGILLERAEQAVVIGIGVNLAYHPALPDRATTDLATHGVSIAPAAFADRLAEMFAAWLFLWRRDGLVPVIARWNGRAHPPGTSLVVRLPDGEAIEGAFDRLDAGGALILRLAGGGTRAIHAGDVFLI